MIAFTVDNPDNPESFNNRKTSRQLFMYEVGNGLLLQSRMYNTSGGTYGAPKESVLYRDLVQRELSELEGVPNLWKTCNYVDNRVCKIRKGEGFGGYPDWEYNDFDAKISIRRDHTEDFKPFKVGTYGLCISCGKEISRNLYCGKCDHDNVICDECGNGVSQVWEVHNGNGGIFHVCSDCLDENYRACHDCGAYYPIEDLYCVGDVSVCSYCYSENYGCCEECNEDYHNDDLFSAINRYGVRVQVCSDCRDADYAWCESCDELVHTDRLHTAHDCHGSEISVCDDCYNAHYESCTECGEHFHVSVMDGGLCPDCRDRQ